MKRSVKTALILAAVMAILPGRVQAEEYETATGEQEETDLGIRPEEDMTGPGVNKRYVWEMRDLNDEYQAGGLTYTEYIQRKREIEDLNR